MTGLLLFAVFVLTAPVPGLVARRPFLPRRPANTGPVVVASRPRVPGLERARQSLASGLRARADMGSARALLELPAAVLARRRLTTPDLAGLTSISDVPAGRVVVVAAAVPPLMAAAAADPHSKRPRVGARGLDDQDL